MPKIKLTFDFPPVAQARPRATRFGRGVRLYDPKLVHAYKTQLAESAQQAISVALRHYYDWLPEATEKSFKSQLIANEVQIEASRWPRWIAGREN